MTVATIYAGKAKILYAVLKEMPDGRQYIGVEYEAANSTTYPRRWWLHTDKAKASTRKAMEHHGLDLKRNLRDALADLSNQEVYITVRMGEDPNGDPDVWPMDPPLDDDAHEAARKLLVGDDDEDDVLDDLVEFDEDEAMTAEELLR